MTHTTKVLAAALTTAFALSTPAQAQDIKLPPTLTMTAYDTGHRASTWRWPSARPSRTSRAATCWVLPAGNDVAGLVPLKAGRAQASAMGVGSYFAQEGVFEFATAEWGPQPLRLMLAATACNAVSLGVAKDTGVKEIKDLKGKRVGMVVGSPALNQNAFAVLAYAGLTKNDVKLVEFSSYGAMWKGIINNDVDAAIASTISGQAKEAEASPRGLVFPPAPAADKDAWARGECRGALLRAAQDHLRAGHQRAEPGGAAVVPLSDLHGLRQPAGRPGAWHHQGDDRQR